MTLQLMDMQPAPPAANVLRENLWQVGKQYFTLPLWSSQLTACIPADRYIPSPLSIDHVATKSL